MVKKRIKRPKDPAALAHLIMGIATGNVKDEVEDGKNPIAVERGRKGGLKGGGARAKALTPKQRTAAAKKAAKGRWKKD